MKNKIKMISLGIVGLGLAVYSISSLAVGDNPQTVNIQNDLGNFIQTQHPIDGNTSYVCTFYPGNNLAYNCNTYSTGPQIPASIQCPLKNGNFGSGYKPFFECIAVNGTNKADDSQCITSDNINYSCNILKVDRLTT